MEKFISGSHFEEKQIEQENHFRVVRYTPHAGHGLIRQVLGEEMAFDEAERLAEANAPVVDDETIVIQDENKTGLDAEILEYISQAVK